MTMTPIPNAHPPTDPPLEPYERPQKNDEISHQIENGPNLTPNTFPYNICTSGLHLIDTEKAHTLLMFMPWNIFPRLKYRKDGW